MIIPYLITGALLILSLIIQSHESFDVIRIAGVKPDIQFVVIVYLAYSFGSFYGEVAGFAGGFLQDSISNSPLCLLAFPKMVLGFLVGLYGRGLIKSNIFTVTVMIFFASIGKGVVTLFLAYIFHQAQASYIISIILPESFYNALIAPPVFVILDRIYAKELE